jgi:hypothetical protein
LLDERSGCDDAVLLSDIVAEQCRTRAHSRVVHGEDCV